MNSKLIEDLRWKAKELAEGPTNISYSFTPAELEKFAELIIRQCANIAYDNYNNGAWPVNGYVLDHFGVE